MAADRKPAVSTREKRIEKAFRRFVELVEPIEDVRHVVAFDEGDVDVFAYIAERDWSVSERIYEAEFKVMDEFDDLPLDFHVRYLEGRSLSAPGTALFYSRMTR